MKQGKKVKVTKRQAPQVSEPVKPPVREPEKVEVR